MGKVILDQENCKSCNYCVMVCPKGALSISQELNNKGYQFVAIDGQKCIQCGICYTVCPDYVFSITGEGGESDAKINEG